MNRLIPTFLKKINHSLLLNYPRVWATQVHYLLWFLLCGTVLAAACAFIPALDVELAFSNERDYSLYKMFNLGFMALVAFVVLVFWLSQFRARLEVFNYKDSLLSVLFCGAVALCFFFFIGMYSAVLEQRKANFLSKNEIEKDMLISYLLTQLMDGNRNNSMQIEDIQVQDYLLSKAECERVRANILHFKILEASNLGNYVQPNMDSIFNGLPYEERLVKEEERDSLYTIFHLRAVSACMSVPDSIKQIYFAISKDTSEIPSFTDYMSYHLPRISPTTNYLLKKYCKNEEVVAVENNLPLKHYESASQVNYQISSLSSSLQRYFAAQQSTFIERFINNSYFSFSNLEQDNRFGENGSRINIFEITKDRVAYLQTDIDRHKASVSYLAFLFKLSIVLFFPLLLLASIIHFGIKDALIGLACFIFMYLATILMMTVSWRFIGTDGQYTLVMSLFGLSNAAIFYFYWKKTFKNKRFVQLFLIASIFGSLVTIFLLVEGYTAFMYEGTQTPYFDKFIYIYYFYAAYLFIILPFIYVLYHRLTYLPKAR